MPRPSLELIVRALLLLVLSGCGQGGGPGPREEGHAEHTAPQQLPVSDEASAKAAKSETPDDVAPAAENPMIRGLEAVLESVPRDAMAESQGELGDSLREADSLLSRIKNENRAAIREVNRQQRLPGQDSPNILLLVAPHTVLRHLDGGKPDETKAANLDRLTAEAVRFVKWTKTSDAAAATHWELMTGRRARRDGHPAIEAKEFTLAELLWQAGYTTALVGDCSLGGAVVSSDPRTHGFDHWFGYRSRIEASHPYPQYLWSDGARLRVLANAEGKRGEPGGNLVIRGVLDYLKRGRQGRPFFLYFVWTMPEGPAVPRTNQPAGTGDPAGSPGEAGEAVGRFAGDLSEIMRQLEALKLHRNTVLILASEDMPAGQAEEESAVEASQARLGPPGRPFSAG